MTNSYESELKKFFEKYVRGCLIIIRETHGNPLETTKQIDRYQADMMKDARKMLKKQVPQWWQQGQTYADLQMKKAGYARQ